MQELSPGLRIIRTPFATRIQIDLEVPTGYQLIPHPDSPKKESANIRLQLLPAKGETPTRQTLELPVAARKNQEVEVEIFNVQGRRVGGGVVVFPDVTDER